MSNGMQPFEPGIQPYPGDAPRSGEYTLDDGRIHEILSRLGIILHGQIADANTFFMRGSDKDHRSALPMDETEVAAWRSVFDIDTVVKNAVEQRSLFVVNIDDSPEALPPVPESGKLSRPFTDAPAPGGPYHRGPQGTVRVNYGGEAHWVPMDRVQVVESTDGLTYSIKPKIHFGGRGHSRGNLYNAFVSLDTFIRASNGTQLVSRISGTGVPGTPTSSPVYHPHEAIKTSLWFNTSVKDEPNNFEVRINRPEQLMMSAAIHDIGKLPELDIPQSPEVRMWFWQLDRLINDERLALPSSMPPTPIES